MSKVDEKIVDPDIEEVEVAPVDTTTYVGLGIHPDARYNSEVIAKLINAVMLDGKKIAATKVVYGALDILAQKVSDKEPIVVLDEALDNVKPLVEVRSKRVGGATYQIPVEVKPRRQMVLAFRWIKDAFRKKKGRSSAEKLANEILDAYNKQGSAMTVRENTHKMAEANKAFAYYA
ncbi:MAG: 30S ribosomal protein S7 [Planctomycetes bacterium]|nr:30S ribosomal protein S7 [Planctomycetota bacterium]